MDARELIPHLGTWPTGPGPLQHKLARGLMDAIRKGAVHPGIRLPSERSLAQALAISRTTVILDPQANPPVEDARFRYAVPSQQK